MFKKDLFKYSSNSVLKTCVFRGLAFDIDHAVIRSSLKEYGRIRFIKPLISNSKYNVSSVAVVFDSSDAAHSVAEELNNGVCKQHICNIILL